jgi:hypothetical protein
MDFKPPKEVEGVKVWKNPKNGFVVFRAHYTADPRKRPDLWRQLEGAGIPKNEWNREYEIDFSSFKGKPVFENDYDDNRMVVKKLPVSPKLPIIRGWDFGYHHPAVVWCQFWHGQQLRVFEADMGTDIDFRQYMRRIQHLSQMFFPNRDFLDCCDFAGIQKKSTGDEEVKIMRLEFGISPRYRYVKINQTLAILRKLMSTTYKNLPNFLVNDSPSTGFLREALRGGYHYDERKEGRSEKEEPADGDHSHVVDALRYVAANFCHLPSGHFKELKKMSGIDTPDFSSNFSGKKENPQWAYEDFME